MPITFAACNQAMNHAQYHIWPMLWRVIGERVGVVMTGKGPFANEMPGEVAFERFLLCGIGIVMNKA
ncbi:hypothetical protein [Paenibacillus aquistagni]|uniref:hypothetical protein n=1 Tax=Paenibacillus aquistagni TaxID=1852522 RepID=UPI00145AC6BD|nr:hypothetical protein [Paenibacillus aquistagni]NMM51484.1 hypothetical protein [Paenibacillus aquistagni]